MLKNHNLNELIIKLKIKNKYALVNHSVYMRPHPHVRIPYILVYIIYIYNVYTLIQYTHNICIIYPDLGICRTVFKYLINRFYDVSLER